jgi:membrane protein implicated in regulation of membrane protease activity
MVLEHRSWIVRVLAYAGTGILILLRDLLVVGALAFLLWGLTAGPLWLQWAISVPLALILLALLGRNFHRERSR